MDRVVTESGRVDKWLWAVRVYKTRTVATDACRAGHVRVNGATAKPASTVRAGDRVVVRSRGFDRELEVLRVIEQRVGPPVAIECFVDHTPPRDETHESDVGPFRRDPAAGRPTKRERRQLDRFRGR